VLAAERAATRLGAWDRDLRYGPVELVQNDALVAADHLYSTIWRRTWLLLWTTGL